MANALANSIVFIDVGTICFGKVFVAFLNFAFILFCLVFCNASINTQVLCYASMNDLRVCPFLHCLLLFFVLCILSKEA